MGKPKGTPLADTLKKAIADTGLNLLELSRECGVPQPMLYRFMQGESGIRLATAERLADYFGLRLVGKATRKSKGR